MKYKLALLILTALFIINSCDSGCDDTYLFKNNLTQPVIYGLVKTNEEGKLYMYDTLVSIQPNESYLAFRRGGFGPSLFDEDEHQPISGFCTMTIYRSYGFIFNDSVHIFFNETPTDTILKSPQWIKYWRVIDENKKHHQHTVEYAIDSVDYQNAIEYCRQQNP